MKRLRTAVVDAPTAIASNGATYHLLTSDQVPGIDGRVTSSGHVAVGCPIHGSDHQLSLHIQVLDPEREGFGLCHSCGARVLVTDRNPKAAANLERSQGRGSSTAPRQARRVTAEALLRSPRRPTATPAATAQPEDWQRAELAELERLAERMRARLADERPRAYLAERAIPYELAERAGLGYIPPDARLTGRMAKWRDRLLFPVSSPQGSGYAGRALHGWQPGMDEQAHKALLDADPEGPRRWEKTHLAGWFGYDALAHAAYCVVTEGAFDALALLASGLIDGDVPIVALASKEMRLEWLPLHIRGEVLALDGDGPGRQAVRDLKFALDMAGHPAVPCVPPADDGGKDWSARWRMAGHAGVWPVATAVDVLTAGAARSSAAHEQQLTAETLAEVAPDVATAGPEAAPWLGDPVIQYLLAHGHSIAEARLLPEVPVQADLLI